MAICWLDHIEHLGRSPTTLYGYRRLVAQMPEGFKALPLKKVTPKVVDDLYRWSGPGTYAELRNVMVTSIRVAGAPAQLCTSSR